MGQVVAFPGHREPELTKQQIAAHFGFGVRWVDYRCQEGMPFRMRGGRRRFILSEVIAWLDEREEKRAS